MALAVYLSLNQPSEGDPHAAVHKAAMVAVDVLGKEATPYRSPPRRSNPRHERAAEHNLHNTITQRSVGKRCEEREDRGDLKYDEESDPIGAPCFSRVILVQGCPSTSSLRQI